MSTRAWLSETARLYSSLLVEGEVDLDEDYGLSILQA